MFIDSPLLSPPTHKSLVNGLATPSTLREMSSRIPSLALLGL